jgi:hypothetical protein
VGVFGEVGGVFVRVSSKKVGFGKESAASDGLEGECGYLYAIIALACR